MNRLNVLVFVGGVVTGILGTVAYMKNQYEIVEVSDLSKEKDKLIKSKREEVTVVGEYKGDDEIAATRIPKVVIEANKRKEIPKEYPQTGRTSNPDFHYHWDRKGIRSEMENVHPSELEVPYDGPEIEVISWEDFNEHYEHHDKLTISYYDGDDILADENDDVMEVDQRAFIGDEALHNFGGMSGDKDVVYVRNHPYTIDYEVVRVHSKYSEVILGQYEDEDKEEEEAS